MNAPAAATGAIASALEQEILGELRRRGIVVWLDTTGTYTPFVDGLAARVKANDFPFPVVPYRGSFLRADPGAGAVRQRSRQLAAAHPHAGPHRRDDPYDSRAGALQGRSPVPEGARDARPRSGGGPRGPRGAGGVPGEGDADAGGGGALALGAAHDYA